MTNVDKIVNRFLGWKLPKDFAPDGGISFKRESDYEHPVFGRSVYEPVGTHLFTTDQAKAMFEYCLQGLAEPVKQEPVALQDIEQYRMQMAGISTAALGYWKEGDSIHPDYDTPALRDVAALYSKYAKLYAAPVQTVKQEPVAHYKDAPHTIYLQTGCDDPEDCECSFNEWGDTTWCTDQIHDTDIPYIRADYAAPVSAEAIRAEALEEAAKVCGDMGRTMPDRDGEITEWCAAAIRARGEK